MVVQKIKSGIKGGEFEMAYKYFSVMSIINDWELVKRDVQLIAYSVSEGKDVSDIKKEFVEKFNSSMATVGNIISKLYKIKILKKDKRRVSVHNAFLFNYSEDLALATVFEHKKGEHGDKG